MIEVLTAEGIANMLGIKDVRTLQKKGLLPPIYLAVNSKPATWLLSDVEEHIENWKSKRGEK